MRGLLILVPIGPFIVLLFIETLEHLKEAPDEPLLSFVVVVGI